MADDRKAIVPVWTLATGDVRVPALAGAESMTAERLTELRSALAALADQPIATLEVHPLPDKLDRNRGISLDAARPLAQHLSKLITQSARNSSAAASATSAGEGLYRMVIPAKVAAKVTQGIVRPMPSKAAVSGIHSALMNSTGIAANATFVPVSAVAEAGALGGAGVTAGVATAGSAALTIAAPLVLMAIAAGASAHADLKRQQAIERITELLEQLHEQKLADERNELDGCRDAIDTATAILLDQGKPGVSLGLDSAVHAIDTAISAARNRVADWQHSLDKLPDGKAVEVSALTRLFPGVSDEGGMFRTHLELAALAIALKRRVIVLQAVEHAQLDPANLFDNFTRSLKTHQQRLADLESSIGAILVRLSALELTGPHGWLPAMATGDVDGLMRAAHRIHKLSDGIAVESLATDVAIEIARNEDGSLIVFPALPTQAC